MKAGWPTFFFLILLCCKCFAQRSGAIPADFLYGKWHCIEIGTKGLQKYTWQQIQQLKASTLVIGPNRFYYTDSNFIEPCNFAKWKISSVDTSQFTGTSLDYIYTKAELSKWLEADQIDDKGKDACFNNCALFYLKNDTLINICGGYTMFLIKQK